MLESPTSSRDQEIQEVLGRIRALMEQHQVGFWTEFFCDVEQRFQTACTMEDEPTQRQLKTLLMDIYGGMGSFGDVFITHLAGDAIAPEDVSPTNRELRELRSRLYELLTDKTAGSG